MAGSPLPPTVVEGWRPRTEAWAAREPSAFAGAPGRPLFIGGCPRSGTTLLRVMLDNHPEIALPHETNFVRPLWWQRREFGDLREEANRRRVAGWIFQPERGGPRLRDGRTPREDAVRRVAEAPPTLGSLVAAALGVYATGHGKPRWGDKRPAYSAFIATLFELFPDAQYVNLVRDPRGAVASQITLEWEPRTIAVPAGTARWEAAVTRTDHAARRLRPDQLLDLRYEDLAADPRAALERLCAFAGLAAGDTIEPMLRRERRNRIGPAHALIAEPVTTASVERWRERISPAEAALVERALAPSMERFGYATDPGLAAARPTATDERELARQRRIHRREWRRSRFDDTLRRLAYRRPVAAVGHERR